MYRVRVPMTLQHIRVGSFTLIDRRPDAPHYQPLGLMLTDSADEASSNPT